MPSNLSRLNKIIPGSARHTARAHIMEEIIEQMVKQVVDDEKLSQEACRAFRALERGLYYSNPLDRPTIEISREQLAAKIRCGFSTLEKYLSAINRLFDTIGLRLQHWDSGGCRIVNGIEETSSNVYHWPSPGGWIIEEATEKIELSIGSKLISGRDEEAERRIFQEMALKRIADPNMQELFRERRVKKTIREAKRADRADDKAREKAEAEMRAKARVVQFPNSKILTPAELTDGYVAGLRASGVGREEAIRLVMERWPTT